MSLSLLPAGAVVGIEHARDVLRGVLVAHGQRVLLLVEKPEIEFLERLALPEAQRAYVRRAVAHDRHVVGHREHLLVREAHHDGLVVPTLAPGIAEALPVVRPLDLEAVLEGLFEQAAFIAEAVTVQRQVVRGGAVQKTSGEPAQTAVAQRRVVDFLHAADVRPARAKKRAHLFEYAKVIQV